jgi:hypothetical protein
VSPPAFYISGEKEMKIKWFGWLVVAVVAMTFLSVHKAGADTENDLKYQVCSSLDEGLTAVNVAKVLVLNGYSVRQAADIVHDAVMDRCIEHYEDVWPT